MTTYVVFAGTNGGMPKFYETLGYINSLVDREILAGPLVTGEIWKEEDMDFKFRSDKNIKQVLKEMNLPQRYLTIRAEVLDKEKLEKETPSLCGRFDLEHRIYEG